MALVVEDGSGKADAESYQSVADADAYHTAFGNTAWIAATTADKEVALRKATRFVETEFEGLLKGIRRTTTQALHFPAIRVVVDGVLIDNNVIPQPLKDAVSVLALSALTEDLQPDLSEPGAIESETNQVGPLKQSVTYMGGKSAEKHYRLAYGYMLKVTEDDDQVLRA